MSYQLPNSAASEELSVKPYLTASGIAHAALILLFVLAAYFHWNVGNQWAGVGGGGSNVKVNLVGSAGIPMPKPETVTESNVVDPTKTLNKPEEKPKPPEPPTKAEKIPEFKKEKPLPPSNKSKVFENKTPQPENAVPGRGGPPNIPTGVGSNPGNQSGVAVQGPGGGDFASRYGWYIESVKRRIQSNWLQNTIDPGIRAARTAHAVAQFTIYKDGTVKDIKIFQTSGNQSMDNSGLRAIMSSSPMPGLPTDYSGSYVTVTFDFDLSMTK
ncbi:MAG TPA: TonB family protein [Dongiaceae bacterium]|nr:TonB family protein [Dongiaceae bacterium]